MTKTKSMSKKAVNESKEIETQILDVLLELAEYEPLPTSLKLKVIGLAIQLLKNKR